MRRGLLTTWRKYDGPTRLREWRLARGLTQEQLATKIRADKGWISKLENVSRRENPSLETIEALATALGIGRDELLEGRSVPRKEETSAEPLSPSLDLYLRDLNVTPSTARRFHRVASHMSPPKTVQQWGRFVEWLTLFTGHDPRPPGARAKGAAKLRIFKGA